jgi:hypothetical protein
VKRLLIAAALATALVLPATALGATKTYGGKLVGGGKIAVDIDVQGGKPTEVLETRFKNVPADCSVAGPSLLTGFIEWSNFLINNGKFAVHDAPLAGGGTATQTGRFSHHNRKLTGKFQESAEHVNPGDQTCTTDTQNYTSKRGAPGPKASHGKAALIARVH